MIDFTRPKKTDGSTYVANIRKPMNVSFVNSKIISVTPVAHTSEFIVLLKNKPMYDFMFDLDQEIINVVKSNYQNWFTSNMNVDLIEDYYSRTLVYKKGHGDLIRIKCIGKSEDYKKWEGGKICDIEIQLKNLRFYKQKFVLECVIQNVEEASNEEFSLIIDENSESETEEEMLPEPEPEEVDIIKKTYIKKLKDRIKAATRLLENLNSAKNFSEMVKVCDEVEQLCA